MSDEKIGEKINDVLSDVNPKGSVKLNLSGSIVVMVFVFVLIVLGAVSHTSDPGKYLMSPITLITVFAVFLALSGMIKLNLLTLLVIIALIVLTMYQDDLHQFMNEIKWDIDYIKRKWEELTRTGAEAPDVKAAVIKKFNEKYAVKKSDTDYYFFIKQVDDVVKERVGHDTWTHNYFLVILPEVIDVDSGVPEDKTADQKITLYAIKHEATVPIVYDYKVYTVRAKAYLIRLGMFEDINTILSWAQDQTLPGAAIPMFIETNILDYSRRVHGNKPYDQFVAKLAEHSYELPDELFIEGD